MPNLFYQPTMQLWAGGDIHWKATGGDTFRCHLIDTADYPVDGVAHDFLGDIPVVAREEGPVTLGALQALPDGVIDAGDITFVGAVGDPCEALVIHKFVTGDGDSPLCLYIDQAVGLPVTLNSGDVVVTWDNGANRIARI
jgi:hypothetical protein